MSASTAPNFPLGPATKVRELMSTAVVSVRDADTVRDVLQRMVSQHISVVPVIDNAGAVVGVVSASDLIKIVLTTDQVFDSDYPYYEDCLWAVELIQRKFGSDKVIGIMTPVVTTAKPNDTMRDAAAMMLSEQVHHLPVVDSDGNLVGILASSEFVSLVAGIS